MRHLDLSIVVPLFNEEDSVQLLHEKISGAMDGTGLSYEILFVDDGSEDRTLDRAITISERDSCLRVVEFRANYGQTPAMAAGIDLARGDVIATMDGDLQNDPADIPGMLAELDDETHIVVGWRKNRQDKLLTRKIPSWVANWVIGKVTGVPIRDNGCSLKVYRADAIKNVPLYSEMHRFIPAMASVVGAHVKEKAVSHHAREFGASKYGLSRVYKVVLDLLSIKTIIGFAQRPMIWFTLLAFPFILASIAAIVSAIVPMLSGTGEGLVLPFVGTGLLYGALALFLVMSGAVAEIVYTTGDQRFSDLASLLATDRRPNVTADESTD